MGTRRRSKVARNRRDEAIQSPIIWALVGPFEQREYRHSQTPIATTLAGAGIQAQTGAASAAAGAKAKEAPAIAPSPKPESATLPADAASIAAVQPIEQTQKPTKAGKSCIAIEPSAACITSAVSPNMRKNILAALRDADVKLCPDTS